MKKNRQLISEEYRNINISLHESDVYGEKNHSINDRVLHAIDACLQIGMCKSTLDYGCGKGVLIKKLRNHFGSSLEINGYDPCVAEYDIPYSPADIVTCFDVLEHIEPDKINDVLDDISKKTTGLFICIVDLLPAQKKLVDGRNAHLLLAPPGWWLDRLSQTFKTGSYFLYENGNLNKKICYVGTNRSELSMLSAEIFAKIFFDTSL